MFFIVCLVSSLNLIPKSCGNKMVNQMTVTKHFLRSHAFVEADRVADETWGNEGQPQTFSQLPSSPIVPWHVKDTLVFYDRERSFIIACIRRMVSFTTISIFESQGSLCNHLLPFVVFFPNQQNSPSCYRGYPKNRSSNTEEMFYRQNAQITGAI